MQIFEVSERKDYPYMEMKDIVEGETVRDIINENNEDKVFLLVDHDTKRILNYNGFRSSFKVQVYGGVLATLLRKQLKLFYRIFSLNAISKDSKEFLETMDKPLGGGRAQVINKEDFPAPQEVHATGAELSVHPFLKINQALEYLDEVPKPENFLRKFMLIGNDIYTTEEITQKFLQEEETAVISSKMGQLNRGFTFFGDANYSTRLIIKERKVQGIELYLRKDDKITPLHLQVPIIYEEKFSTEGNIETIVKAFQIPDKLPEEGESQE